MNKQKAPRGIEWTRIKDNPDAEARTGYTWNPVAGCKHGCRWTMPDGQVAICYAETVAEGVAKHAYQHGFEHHYWHPDKLDEPLKVKRPAGIFMDSMSDLMGAWVEAEQVEQVLDVCRRADWHIFQLLTKNAPRLLKFEFPGNVWVGASSPPDYMFGRKLSRNVQSRMLHKTLDVLSRVDVPVRWISFEPLSWDVSEIVASHPGAIQWAVIGAASNGRNEYPPEHDHLVRLLDVLDAQGCKVFFKGNLRSLPYAAANWRENFPNAWAPPTRTNVPTQMEMF